MYLICYILIKRKLKLQFEKVENKNEIYIIWLTNDPNNYPLINFLQAKKLYFICIID